MPGDRLFDYLLLSNVRKPREQCQEPTFDQSLTALGDSRQRGDGYALRRNRRPTPSKTIEDSAKANELGSGTTVPETVKPRGKGDIVKFERFGDATFVLEPLENAEN